MPLGPEKIKEEASTEYGRDCNADEDVERGDADKVVIMYSGRRMQSLYLALLFDIVCESRKSDKAMERGGKRRSLARRIT